MAEHMAMYDKLNKTNEILNSQNTPHASFF